MNKLTTTILAVLGGIEAVYSVASPFILSSIFVYLYSFSSFSDNLIMFIGSIASIFRAIKIGWLKE